MASHKRRSAPTYLVRLRGRWHGSFHYVDSLGSECWRRAVSPYPSDYQRSLAWAAACRLDWIRQHETELRQAEEERKRPPTLGELLDAYRADCEERGTRLDREASRARRVLDTLGRATPYTDLTPARIAAWRASLREQRHLSARALNAYVTLLQGALNLVVRRGAVPANPLRYLGKIREPERIPEPLSQRQVQALVAALDDYEARIAAGEATAAGGGVRRRDVRRPDPAAVTCGARALPRGAGARRGVAARRAASVAARRVQHTASERSDGGMLAPANQGAGDRGGRRYG